MLNTDNVNKVYLAAGVTDLRKSIDGLAAIVVMSFKLDVYSNSMFVFCNRRRDRIKILHWNNGFWLYYHRIERGKLNWPGSDNNSDSIGVSMDELMWILKGYEARTMNKLKVEKGSKFQ
jgi:transposase